MNTQNNIEKVNILGVKVNQIDLPGVLKYIIHTIHHDKKAIIAYVNVHAINLTINLQWFRDFLNHTQIVFCDGFGVKWAAKFLYQKDLFRFTPPDWFDLLASKCVEEHLSLYLLGTRQETIEKASEVLQSRYPNLSILGVHHGFFDKLPTSPDNQEIINEINRLRPNILVVGFGMPTQEKWIMENWQDLQVNIALPVGAFFDYLTGEVTRAPRWMTDHGFEWLGRLVIEPHRLWKRYVIGNPLFIWRVLCQKAGLRKS